MGNVIEGVSAPVTLNVSQRLLQVMEQVSYLKKDKVVEGYKTVTHDQVTGELRKWFVKFGLLIVPKLVSSNTVLTGAKTSKGAEYVRVEAVYDVAIVNADNPGDVLLYTVLAHALDHGDKGPGKALSYAVKSVLLKSCMIETGENDESRINGEFTADDIIGYEDRANEAKTAEELHEIFSEMRQEAEQCGDRGAYRRLRAHFEKRGAEIKRAALMPGEKAQKTTEPDGKNGWPPADTNAPPPAAPAPKDDPAPEPKAAKKAASTEELASEAAHKMLKREMEAHGKDPVAFVDKFGFGMTAVPKSQIAGAMAWARS